MKSRVILVRPRQRIGKYAMQAVCNILKPFKCGAKERLIRHLYSIRETLTRPVDDDAFPHVVSVTEQVVPSNPY